MSPDHGRDKAARKAARAAFHLERTDAWLANMHPEHFPPDVEPAP